MTVAPAGSAILTVTANVPTSATAGSPLSGSLTLETNDPSTPTIDVDLAVTPLGATLTFDPEGVPSPSEADFGPHRIGEDAQEYATIRLYLINSGNQAAVVSIGAATDPQFALSTRWLGSLTAAADAGAATLVPSDEILLFVVFTPTSEGKSAAISPITVAGAVCGNSVAEISYSGQGTAGGVSGWPTPPVEFVETSSGPMTCATPTAIGAGLSLSNPGATDVTITSIVFDTPGYSTSMSAGMKVVAGGQLDVPITGPTPPATPGPATYEAGLVVTTDAPGDVPHPIRIVTKCL